VIRDEAAADIPAVRRLLVDAFPSCGEADLVDRLRAEGSAVFSLVAVEDQAIVGHVMFSQMEQPDRALGLAPVAVLSACRRRGIAAALIRVGLSRAAADGWESVFVLGDPTYYNRFGFAASLASGFVSPYAGPHLMALALREGALAGQTGELRYPPQFSALG
jgi:putative acetyltransferase